MDAVARFQASVGHRYPIEEVVHLQGSSVCSACGETIFQKDRVIARMYLFFPGLIF